MRGIRRAFPAVAAVGAVAVAISIPRALEGQPGTPIEVAAPPSSSRTVVNAPLFPRAAAKRIHRIHAAPPVRPQRIRLAPAPQLASRVIVHEAARPAATTLTPRAHVTRRCGNARRLGVFFHAARRPPTIAVPQRFNGRRLAT